MDELKHRRLTKLALEGLRATRNDREQWSYVYPSPGDCAQLSYCSWDEISELDFDGRTEGLDLPWSKERLAEIASGADPDERELRQWQEARAHSMPVDGCGYIACIKRVTAGGRVEGYALFSMIFDASPPIPEPTLLGVFDTAQEALEGLKTHGIVSSNSLAQFDAWYHPNVAKRFSRA